MVEHTEETGRGQISWFKSFFFLMNFEICVVGDGLLDLATIFCSLMGFFLF